MGWLDWLFGRRNTDLTNAEQPHASANRTPHTGVSRGHIRLPTGPFRFVALDVETANNWQGSICQIGLACVRMDGSIETVSILIDPEAPFDAFNVDLHGIGPATVAGAPKFRHVLPQIAPLLTRQPVVQHSNFDSRAITAACNGDEIDPPNFEWVDSVQVARRAWPDLQGNGGHGLANLKTHLSLSFRHHDAAEDARAAAEVVLHAEHATGMDFRQIIARRSRPSAHVPKVTADGAPDGRLAGQIAVFTGSLSMSRELAVERAATAGITVAANVTLKTTLVIVGEQDLAQLAGQAKSTKHRKAEEYIARGRPIRIITEDEFLRMIGMG